MEHARRASVNAARAARPQARRFFVARPAAGVRGEARSPSAAAALATRDDGRRARGGGSAARPGACAAGAGAPAPRCENTNRSGRL
jgi:hypothetical protein